MSDIPDDFTPPRQDGEAAARWRGPLFDRWDLALSWREPVIAGGETYMAYRFLERPNSVTFPICSCCRHVIWEWPHFEEQVPENAACDACCEEEMESQRRENERDD